MTGARPRVSVAIPLYRSARFVDNVSANIESMPSGIDVEVLISDRHVVDDALDRLRRRHGHDQRLRFLRHRDGRDWIDHINILLKEARGDYWRLMPHDDFSSGSALQALIQCLDENPTTLLAYGPTTAVDIEGHRLPERDHTDPHPIDNDDPWTLGLALDSFERGHFNGAFKGLLRRREITDRGLWIRRTPGTVYAERLWLTALTLVGRFRFVPNAPYLKRFHAESAHARWRPGFVHELGAGRVLMSYFHDLVPDRRLRRSARGYLLWLTWMRLGWAARPIPYPSVSEPFLPRRILRRLSREWTDLHRTSLRGSGHTEKEPPIHRKKPDIRSSLV